MLVTFVVRLLPDRLAAGELVGEVEHVGGGEHGLLQGESDLLGFAQRAAASGSEKGGGNLSFNGDRSGGPPSASG